MLLILLYMIVTMFSIRSPPFVLFFGTCVYVCVYACVLLYYSINNVPFFVFSRQLIEDTGGFRTFASRIPGSGLLSLRGETVVNEHIGRLYTSFLNTTSTLDWVRFLVEAEELPTSDRRNFGRGGAGKAPAGGKQDSVGSEGDGVLFQKYDMPWPVKDREVVLLRNVRLDKRAKKMVATCEIIDLLQQRTPQYRL